MNTGFVFDDAYDLALAAMARLKEREEIASTEPKPGLHMLRVNWKIDEAFCPVVG